MNNTSLSGLLRGAQTRHDDCGISWQSHKLPVENCEKNDRLMKLAAELIGAALSATRAKDAFDGLGTMMHGADQKQHRLVARVAPPCQYRNPRIDGPVVGQDDMEQRKEWLDTIARESERLGLD